MNSQQGHTRWSHEHDFWLLLSAELHHLQEEKGDHEALMLIWRKYNLLSLLPCSSAVRTNVNLLHGIVHSDTGVRDSLHKWIEVAHHHSFEIMKKRMQQISHKKEW